MFNAHIFGRRSRGDREEVRLALFDSDGNPVSIPAAANSLDVPPFNLNMTPAWPDYPLDCAGRSMVHVQRMIIPASTTVGKGISISLNDLVVGTPYQISIDNASNFEHAIYLYVNGTRVSPPVVAGGPRVDTVYLPPNQMCSIMGLYTGGTDRPLAVVTRPGSPPIRRVTGSYALAMNYDVNALIFVNSAGPATITLRDLENSETWFAGEEVEIYQEGAGAVTVAGGVNTITRPGGAAGNFVLPGRYCSVKLRCVDFAEWVVVNYTPLTGL